MELPILSDSSKSYVECPIIVPEDRFLDDDQPEVVDIDVNIPDTKIAKPIDRERVQTKIPYWRVFRVPEVPVPDETVHLADLQKRFHIQTIVSCLQ